MFSSHILELIQQWGGIWWIFCIAFLILFLIGVIKMSRLRPHWDRLRDCKGLVAPLLGVLLGILNMHPFSWAGCVAYFGAGAGALVLSDLLDAIKAIPGLGPTYIDIVNVLSVKLGARKEMK